MADNYTCKVYGKNGKIIASLKNASINTAFNALPYMIEDAILRSEGTGAWDIYGEELGSYTIGSITNKIRDTFRNTLWFDKLDNEGESVIMTVKVKMEHS